MALMAMVSNALAQEKVDTSRGSQLKEKIIKGKVTQQVITKFSRKSADTVFNVKSEDAYLPYEGKIIRRILIEHVGFDRMITDTARNLTSVITRVATHLHSNTKEWVVRNNLFIKEGEPMNSFRTADNERYLRDKDFILDARIYVLQTNKTSDSVDLLVVTRDVFSLGLTVSPNSTTSFKAKLQDNNLFGMGQGLEATGILDPKRNPRTGTDLMYRKNNVGGTFIDATLDYTQLNTGSSVGNENETAIYLRLSRALYMPYSRWAGGVEWSNNFSRNVGNKSDTLFARYQYNINDVWVGYSFGHQKKQLAVKENRNRKFIALRGFQQSFGHMPQIALPSSEKFYYRNRQSLLAQITLFRQDFYKTQYVLGFGRTEDVPHGYRLSLTGGMEKELGLTRPYTDAELYYSYVRKTGTFLTYNVKLASYYNRGRSEEGIIDLNIARFSPIYKMGDYKVRHQTQLGYSRQFNEVLKRQLNISDVNGITGLHADSLVGNRRLVMSEQAIIFTPWKLLGFKLAPIVRMDLALLAPKHEAIFQGKNFISGFMTGMRARNENLIFNTLEAKIIYYPKTGQTISHFRFDFQVNLRLKYPTTLVSAPATYYDRQIIR